MGFDEWPNTVPGRVPDFGAIFMSNSATKKECFRRKLFGLPFSQAHFVKQVKAGMILFLFEFERRQLHGVFQACSDGAINIVPYAFNSSGKQFPAQVKFTTIWYCSPLSEDEFSDAIKENYFSANKFNFGLSEDQVHRLLSLFSLRKLRDHQPQRQLTTSEVAKSTGYALSKVRRADDDGKFVLTDRVKDKSNADSRHGSVILPDYPEDSFGNSGRLIGYGRFATSASVGNVHEVDNNSNEFGGDSLHKIGRVRSDSIGSERNVNFERRPSISTEYPGYYLGSVRRVPDDVRLATSDRLETEYNDDNGFKPAFSTDYPGFFQSNLNISAYSCKPILEADSLVQDQLGPYSTSRRPMDPQISNLSYPNSYGDAFVTANLPYDPDDPSINNRSLSYFEVNQSSAPSQNSYVGTFPSYESQSYNHFPLPYPNNYEYSCRTGMPFSGSAYSESMATNSSENQEHRDHSVPKPSFLESESNGTINKGPSSYSISPRKYPSFGLDYGYLAASRDRIDHEMPQREKNEAFAANVPMFEGNQCQLQGFVSSIESESIEHCEDTLLNPDVCQNSDRMYSGCQKNRNSVFSRLALAPEVGVQENGTPVDSSECEMDTSVDEIMGLLHQSHYQWVRMRRPKPVIRRYDAASAAAANFRNKKENYNSKLLNDRSAVISKEMSMNAGEENDNQMVEGTPFVDFKRRSKLRKIHDDTMTSSSNDNPESEGSSGLQHKKRKLIRPSFNRDEPPGDKGINDDTSQIVQVASLGSSVSKDNSGSSEVLVRSQNNENKVRKNVELPHVMCQIGREDKNVGAEGDWKCKGEEKVESCRASFRNADEDGKESFENSGNQNVPISVSCEENRNISEDSLSIKDSMLHGLPEDYNNATHSNVQESSLKILEGIAVTEIAYGEIKCDGGAEEMLQRVKNVVELHPINGEISISDPMNCSSNQYSELETVPSELVDGDGKGNQQQLILESGSKQCETSAETISGFTMQESSQAICDGNSGHGEVLVTTNGKDSEMNFHQNVENGHPNSSETIIGQVKTISTTQNLEFAQDLEDNGLNDEGKDINLASQLEAH